MYKIIGADLKEYGPITADQLRQWISEGRVNGDTKVQAEGATTWKRVAELPEFASALPAAAPPAVPSVASYTAPAPVVMVPGRPKTNQLAVWAMVVGIVGLLCCQVLGPVAIILGSIALSQIKKNPGENGSGFAITGIVLGCLSLVIMMVIGVIMATVPDFWTNIQKGLNQ